MAEMGERGIYIMSMASYVKSLESKRKLLARLNDDIKKREVKLRWLRYKESLKQKAGPKEVKAGTVVAKIWPRGIDLSDMVRLYGYLRTNNDGAHEGSSYEYTTMTGDPEEDRWRKGRHRDSTGPTFIRASAAKRWDRLAKAMNNLIKNEAVIVKELSRD